MGCRISGASDGDRAEEISASFVANPPRRCCSVLQVITANRDLPPRQPLAREEDCEQPIGVFDQRTDVAIERILPPARARTGLIEHALVFVDEENKALAFVLVRPKSCANIHGNRAESS